MQKKKHMEGYLTVYLTLIMTVMLSLYLALIEGARSNAIRLEAECVTDIGLNSVMAEYHRELYRQYNLFGIDTSYGTFRAGSEKLEAHLKEYLDNNLSMDNIFLEDFLYKDFLAMSVGKADLTHVQIMTDHNGAVFRKKAVEAIRDDVGIGLLEQLSEWTKVVTNEGLLERDIAAEKSAIDQELDSYDGMVIQIWEEEEEEPPEMTEETGKGQQGNSSAKEPEQIEEEEWVVVDINNPTDGLEQIRRKGILDVVINEPQTLSVKTIAEDTLIEARMEEQRISTGNYDWEEMSGIEELQESFFFQEYLLKYMGRYGCAEEENALCYQMEYLLFGEKSDIENLRKTANLLCALRQVANAVYIYSDEVKCAEAQVLSTVLALACHMPDLEPLFRHTILLGWAYAESLYDVKTILGGGRIPLMKDKDAWHYDLGAALQMGQHKSEEGEGLSYEDYLRILMYFTDVDTLTVRAMNLIEADIRLKPGNEYFRLDSCYVCVEFCVRIESAYGYQYEMVRQKQY